MTEGNARGLAGNGVVLPEVNGLAMVDVMWTIEVVFPGRGWWNTQGVIDRGGQIFRALGVGRWIRAIFVRRSDNNSALDTSTRDKDRLHGAPMISAW